MGMLNLEAGGFLQPGDLHDVCTQNYIYRRWFDDFR